MLNRFACCFQIVLFFPLPVCVSMNVPEPTRSLSLPLGKPKIGQPLHLGDSLILSLRGKCLPSQVTSLWENPAYRAVLGRTKQVQTIRASGRPVSAPGIERSPPQPTHMHTHTISHIHTRCTHTCTHTHTRLAWPVQSGSLLNPTPEPVSLSNLVSTPPRISCST